MTYRSSIKPNKKKCKGTGKAKNFPSCGENEYLYKYGLCHTCFKKWLYSTDEGREQIKKLVIKIQKPRKELEKAEQKKKQKSALKRAKEATRISVHKFIRIRDKGKPCISCGTSWHEDFQAGHYFKAELYETLKYDLDNIHGQCPKCNIYDHGNVNGYTQRLPQRIGKDNFDKLVKKAKVDKQFSKVWDTESLKKIRENVKRLKAIFLSSKRLITFTKKLVIISILK